MAMRLCIGLLSLFALTSSLACDSDRRSPTEPPPTELGSVTFEYHAATETDPSIRDRFPDCWTAASVTHMHPSWREFRDLRLQAEGAELWTVTADDVPVGSEQQIYLTDRNACSATNPVGAVTSDIFANGVELVRVVDVTAHGDVRPGLAFTLLSDGTVVP